MVYAGVLAEGELGGVPAALECGICGVNVGFVIASGRGIAMDSAHGVLFLALAFSLRRASSDCLSCSGILCDDVLRRSLSSSLCSGVKL